MWARARPTQALHSKVGVAGERVPGDPRHTGMHVAGKTGPASPLAPAVLTPPYHGCPQRQEPWGGQVSEQAREGPESVASKFPSAADDKEHVSSSPVTAEGGRTRPWQRRGASRPWNIRLSAGSQTQVLSVPTPPPNQPIVAPGTGVQGEHADRHGASTGARTRSGSLGHACTTLDTIHHGILFLQKGAPMALN